MALQHHFVVVVEDGKAWIDWSMYPNLDEIRTYDTKSGDWVDFDDLTDKGSADLQESESLIETIIEMHNNPKL